MAEQLDVAVIGGGIAGLTAAAALAKEGLSVRVFEKHSKLGGYAQYFGQNPTFDSSTHLVGGAGTRGWTRRILEDIGVYDRIEWIPLDPIYHAVWPEHRYSVAANPERFRQELSALWPAEAENIRRFFEETDAIGRDYLQLADGRPPQGPLARHHDRTLKEYLDDFTRSEELRAALSGLWLFAGLPPERLSAVHYASLWHTYQIQGSASIKGGARAATQAMAEFITEHGGAVESRTRVQKILRNRGQVTGVRLEDGREYATRAVINTAAPHETFEELLAAEGQTAAGYAPLRGFVFSISAMQVHMLVDGPVEVPARTTILHTTYDLEEAYQDLQRGEPEFSALVCSVLDHGDPDRAPAGKHLVSLFTLAPYGRADNWHAPFDDRRGPTYRTLEEYTALKERLGDEMVSAAEEVFPGLSSRVVSRKVGTPLSMERYTFNTGGAAFGWANIPQQTGANRPGPKTPFRGLYMAGHWTFPGGSIAGAVASGSIAAATVLDEG
jgi:phytoene dehydrogenase-like protein